jgi:hypothetical protein
MEFFWKQVADEKARIEAGVKAQEDKIKAQELAKAIEDAKAEEARRKASAILKAKAFPPVVVIPFEEPLPLPMPEPSTPKAIPRGRGRPPKSQ